MAMLAGHNVLITGASRGLGARIAAAFWEAGANVILVARSARALGDVAAGLFPGKGQQAVTLVADLGDPLAADQIIDGARKEFRSIHVLVNNAGMQGPIGSAWTNNWDQWRLTLQVNLLSPVALCRRCVPWMAEAGGGKIINLSEGGATAPRPNFTSYATAKAALVRFSETLAEEVRGLGIDVNCIAPGAMDSALLAEIVESGPSAAGQQEYESALNVRRSGGALPERAADLCLFLASAASDGITGKLISGVWSPWETFPEHRDELKQTDVYTLRRIVPKDRGLTWGEK